MDIPKEKRYLPFKCPNCNGYGTVSYGKKKCHACNGVGIVTIDQKTGLIVKNGVIDDGYNTSD
jgi:DnaJ-class molecular chaperone